MHIFQRGGYKIKQIVLIRPHQETVTLANNQTCHSDPFSHLSTTSPPGTLAAPYSFSILTLPVSCLLISGSSKCIMRDSRTSRRFVSRSWYLILVNDSISFRVTFSSCFCMLCRCTAPSCRWNVKRRDIVHVLSPEYLEL